MAKRGRPKTGKKNSQQLRKETRERLKELGKRNRKFVYMTCQRCKREVQIHINRDHEDLYTDDLKKNYICAICR